MRARRLHPPLPVVALLLLLGATAGAPVAGAVPEPATRPVLADSADHRAITAARQRSNEALAKRDTAAIAAEWWPDVHVVSSTSAQLSGTAANARRLAEQFARRPDTRYVRTPEAIDVWTAWEVASERGRWVGTWTDPDGPVRIEGTYQAQWRRRDGQWRIQAELFVPLACRGGAYCRAHP